MKIYQTYVLLVFSAFLLLSACDRGNGEGTTSLTTYSFVSPLETGAIDENAKTISVIVPHGTDVTALVATFTTTGANVMVGDTIQVSGTTPNNFVNSVVYTVTDADGLTATYTVTVTVAVHEIYVTNKGNSTVSVFDASADGNVIMRLCDPSGFSRRSGIAVDTVNNQLFVVNYRAIEVYERTAKGALGQVRAISGGSTGLYHPRGIAVDTVNNDIFVTNFTPGGPNDVAPNNSITVYGRTDSGNVRPTRTISGAHTGLWVPNGIVVDTVNNQIFVTNSGSNSIKVFRTSDNGDVSPIRTIFGASTGLSYPYGIAFDAIHSLIFVTDSLNNSLMVFGTSDSGDVAPIRTISGANTGLSVPQGIAVDTTNNKLFVTNGGNDSITVYGSTDSGNIAPERTIAGTSAGLSNPVGIALW